MYRSTPTLDRKGPRGTVDALAPDAEGGEHPAAVGGQEIPAPGHGRGPTEIQLAAARGSLDAKCRSVLGSAAQATGRGHHQLGVRQRLAVCTVFHFYTTYPSPPRPWPKTPSRENSSAVATTQSHWCLTAAPVSQPRHRQHRSPARLRLHRLASSSKKKSRRIFDVDYCKDFFVKALEAPPGPRSTTQHTRPARPTAFTTASITEQYQRIGLLPTANNYHRYTIAQHGVHFRASARGRPR